MKALGSCYKRNIEKKNSYKEEILSHPKSRKAPQQFPFPSWLWSTAGLVGAKDTHISLSYHAWISLNILSI